jgi:hypothetical protein
MLGVAPLVDAPAEGRAADDLSDEPIGVDDF